MSEKAGQNLQQQLNELYEEQFWHPCATKEQLRLWINTYLGIDLPAQVVSDLSTSSPMDFIWDVYSAALYGSSDKTSFVVAAARNSMKTLSSAIIEFLMMVHFGRDIVHQSAILDQSLACIDYLDKFLLMPIIKPYSKTDNKRFKEMHNTPLNAHKRVGYSKLKVIVATKKSANAQRASVLVFDELDLIDRDILSESTFIADPDRLGKPPIFIYLSSRKTAVGPVQEKIELSSDPDAGITLHKWNTVDFMKKCPPEKHLPEKPKVPLYIHQDTLQVKNQEQYDSVPSAMKEAFDKVDAFEGCRKCPAFVVCRSESVRQEGDSASLRDIPFVASVIRDTGDPEKINAQMLNLKPESGGTVFNKFSRHKHVLSLEETWEFAFCVPPSKQETLDKDSLISELRANGWRLHCGVDFGWVDTAFAVLVAYQKSSDKLIVLHTEASPGFSAQDWLEYVRERIFNKWGFDLLCPDTADKSTPTYASSIGMPSRNSKPKNIAPGVSWIRTRLWNASKQETQFAILEDEMNPSMELFQKSLESWQYMKSQMGYDYNQFADDDWTHAPDALRYAIDPFLTKETSVLSASQTDNSVNRKPEGIGTVEKMNEMLKKHYFDEYGIDINEKESDNEINTNGGVTITF